MLFARKLRVYPMSSKRKIRISLLISLRHLRVHALCLLSENIGKAEADIKDIQCCQEGFSSLDTCYYTQLFVKVNNFIVVCLCTITKKKRKYTAKRHYLCAK